MSVRPLCAELQQIAERELNEVSSRVPQDLQHIREWLLKQPHLNARMDAQWLIIFLRSCKFSLERTKEKLDRFYTAKTLLAETLSIRDPFADNVREILNTRSVVVLSDTLQYTKPSLILGVTNYLDPDIHTMYDIWKIVSMIFDIYSAEDDAFSVNGVETVIDLKNVNYKYIGQLTPTFLISFAEMAQKAYPIRVKKIIFTNAKPWFTTFYNTAKHIMKTKLHERFIICEECEDFLDNIPRAYSFPKLIEEFCGKNVTWDELAVELKDKLENSRDWFLEDAKYGVDDTQRLETTNNQDIYDYGGVQGAFRKLDID